MVGRPVSLFVRVQRGFAQPASALLLRTFLAMSSAKAVLADEKQLPAILASGNLSIRLRWFSRGETKRTDAKPAVMRRNSASLPTLLGFWLFHPFRELVL